MTSSHRRIYQTEYDIDLNGEDVIHHIDLDHKNNDISNLHLTDIYTHRRIHTNCYNTMKRLLKYHLKKGDVLFDNGKYRLKNHRRIF